METFVPEVELYLEASASLHVKWYTQSLCSSGEISEKTL